MELIKNLAKAQRIALRKAVELDRPQPLVEIAGWYAVPSRDEFEFDCCGAQVLAVYGPAGSQTVSLGLYL